MKPICKPLATALAALLVIPLLAAPRPLSWRADFPSARVENFPVRHGTDVDFRPTWYVNGSPADTNGWTYSLSVQTNGAPAGEWATIPGTVFSHTNDCGAEAYNVLVRAVDRDGTVDYSAAARLRMLPSPGFEPGALPPADTFQEDDPVFSAWLATFEIPGTSLEPATNYTAQSLASFAATGTVSRASSYGTPTRWTDATGCVWEVTLDGAPWMDGDKVLVYTNDEYGASWVWGGIDWLQYSFGTWSYECGHRTASFVAIAPEDTTVLVMHDISSDPPLADVTLVRPTLTNLVGRVAYTNDLPTTPSEVGAAPASLVQAVTNLQVESALVYRLYSGSNVVAEVTNYSSQVHAPSLRLMQLNESNEYVTVWTEANGLARTLKRANEYTDDATGAVARSAAPRAWSRTTSGLGAEAPSNTTWISTPTTVIAGGFEYAKFVDTYGEVWVLTSNGMAAEFNPDTNAYFRITADDGTPVFSVEKSDAQLAGANSAGITVGESSITIPVPVVSSTAPTMWWSESLSSGFWDNESSPPTGATVTWSGTAGSWVCTVSFTGTRPSSMFFKFKFLQEGGVVIRNNATTDLSSGIYVNGTKFVPTVSGNNLIWTKQ